VKTDTLGQSVPYHSEQRIKWMLFGHKVYIPEKERNR